MFERDYAIIGKHATYLKAMAKKDNKDNPDQAEHPFVYSRYIDVYMNAAIWGLLYGRRVTRDNSSKDRARIYADAFNGEHDQCVFLYRLVMLLDESTTLTPEERVDRAFKDDARPDNDEKNAQNMELFHSYVLGGIEVLYERITDGCTTQEDYVDRIYNLMAAFKDELSNISYEEQLANLMIG